MLKEGKRRKVDEEKKEEGKPKEAQEEKRKQQVELVGRVRQVCQEDFWERKSEREWERTERQGKSGWNMGKM